MSIVYIPIHKKGSIEYLEPSIPSALEPKIRAKEWEEIIYQINALLSRRAPSFFVRVFTAFFIGIIYQRYKEQRIDKEISDYIERKNILLQEYGICIHHPREREYSGMDVSIYSVLSNHFII